MEDETRHRVVLLSRTDCPMCEQAAAELAALLPRFGMTHQVIDVDAVADTRPELRAEFGDRLPVVLLDGAEHSYWEVDTDRLVADLSR